MAENRLEFLNDEVVADDQVTDDAQQVEDPAVDDPDHQTQAEAEGASTDAPDTDDKGDDAAPPAAVDREPDWTPLKALMDEREKRQAREREAQQYQSEAQRHQRELEALRRQIAEQEEAKKAKAPDFYENPDERLRYESSAIQRQFDQQRQQDRLESSRFFAEREFGKDEVDAAVEYFNQYPDLSQQMLNHPSPFHAAVEYVRKQRVADEIGTDPDAYKKRVQDELREQLREEIRQEMASQGAPQASANPPPSKPRIPGSLSSAPAAKGPDPATHDTNGPLAGFFSS
jgi:hypothetical protein